jgi:hypothetical protein
VWRIEVDYDADCASLELSCTNVRNSATHDAIVPQCDVERGTLQIDHNAVGRLEYEIVNFD